MNKESFVKVNDLQSLPSYYSTIHAKEYNDDLNKQINEIIESGLKELNTYISEYNAEQTKIYNKKSFMYKLFNKKNQNNYTEKRLREFLIGGYDFWYEHIYYASFYKKFSKIVYSYNRAINTLECLKINENQLKKILNLTKYGTDIYLCTSDAIFIEDCKNKISSFLNKKENK